MSTALEPKSSSAVQGPYSRDTPISAATTSTTLVESAFKYPPHYSFPPFFTLQPNQTTRASQLASWSSLILSHCAYSRTFRMTAIHPIFTNSSLHRSLSPSDARQVLDYMIERGRLEWIDLQSIRKREKDKDSLNKGEGDEAWVWWRTPEEWAQDIIKWVEETGQRNRVLTFYELLEGDATVHLSFHGLPREMAQKAVGGILGRRGKATLMGEGEGLGAKFF